MQIDESASIICPYCGESFEITTDLSQGEQQSYIEDCYVCCRPITIEVGVNGQGELIINTKHENE